MDGKLNLLFTAWVTNYRDFEQKSVTAIFFFFFFFFGEPDNEKE